jgi:hypothetical protein
MIKFLTKLKTFVTRDANMENKQPTEKFLYTDDQLMARLKFFVGVCLALTLTGIVFVVLYSIIFVTQPLNAISPIDQKFFELIIPIATFLTGTLSGIMLAGGNKDAQEAALKAANSGWDRVPPTPPAPTTPSRGINSIGSFGVGAVAGAVIASNPEEQTEEANTRKTFTADEVPDFDPAIVTGYGGLAAPTQPPQPEI